MEEASKNLDSMELPELLKHIVKNTESIQKESQELNNSKNEFLQKVETIGFGLDQKIEEIKNLSAVINRDIAKTYQQEKSEMNTFFDSRMQEFSNVSFNLSEKDRKQLQKADGVLQKWWKFPVLISVVSLLISLLLGFLAVKFYSSSVKSKEEIKGDIAREMQSKNLIWIEKGEWNKLKEDAELVKLWSEKNPKDSKSLESFIKGYETFKKEKK
jgi:hypothetical protein